MITKETKTIKNIEESDAVKTDIYKVTGTVYDKNKKELKFNVNTVSGKGFRLVHDFTSVISIVEGTEKTITQSIHTIEEFKTEKECFYRIKELKLLYEAEQTNKEMKGKL